MRFLPSISLLLCALVGLAHAQFGFFEQMFGGQQQQQQPQNVPSDSSVYRANYERAHCSNYLCPDTLGKKKNALQHRAARASQYDVLVTDCTNCAACVHYPHHCPCAWPANEDKFELAEGQRICVSKGGFKAGEAERKVELARKGLL